MQIIEVSSSLETFRTVRMRAGMNILLAEKTREVGSGDTRNGTGKSSFVRLVRYLLGGNAEKELRDDSLKGTTFSMKALLNSESGTDEVLVSRTVGGKRTVSVSGWSRGSGELRVADWCDLLAKHEFQVPDNTHRPTLAQLRGQFFRNYFQPTKIYSAEPDWESGARIGFLLGLDSHVLSKAGGVARLRQQRTALQAASKEGALDRFELDVPGLEGRLAAARSRRDRAAAAVKTFTVDERYREHQSKANTLSLEIRRMNDRALALDRRLKDIGDALRDEVGSSAGSSDSVSRLYSEVGLVLPALVMARYQQVKDFHESVLRNRKMHLESEQSVVANELAEIESARRELDTSRAALLTLLQSAVALETFLEAESSVLRMDSEISGLEQRLEFAKAVDSIGDEIKLASIDAKQSVTAELASHQTMIDHARALFAELAQEVYGRVREQAMDAELRIGASSSAGFLDVAPRISGDASVGIRSVETFLLDMVLAECASMSGRSPRVLIHDSHIFDAVDSEQVASCLLIGERMAERLEMQYVVTINSDDLGSAVAESGDEFDPFNYVLDTQLGDEVDALRLYGRQID